MPVPFGPGIPNVAFRAAAHFGTALSHACAVWRHDPGLANAFVWAESLPPKDPAHGPQRSRSAAAKVAMRYYREGWKE